MNEVLERRFAEMGARVSLGERPWRGRPRIDVRTDAQGEVFTIDFSGRGTEIEVEVVDVQPRDRHLLLLVRDGGEKSKFLCGHDERHWFVAAVPETARGVTGVTTAKIALQPEAVQDRLSGVRPKDRLRRRNAAFVRQGEWFFVPTVLWPEPLAAHVLRDEPLSRGRGKAHIMQFAFRRGGNVVWVNRSHPTGIGEAAYQRLSAEARAGGRFTQMVRDPEVYAKGAVRHPDHATIHLASWHRVFMNTEQRAQAMRHVAFLD
jgi:hypothetical protein